MGVPVTFVPGQFLTASELNTLATYLNRGTTVAKAYRNAAQATGSSANWYKVQFDAAAYDPGSNFDISTNHRYIAPVTGYYQADGAISAVGNNGGQIIGASLFKNGSEYGRGSYGQVASTTGQYSMSASDIVQCSAGDYIELFVYNNGGNAISLNVASPFFCYLSVCLIAS